MTEQEQFEADYLAACPKHGKQTIAKYKIGKNTGKYVNQATKTAFRIWQQQAARHKAEIAELVNALKPFAALLQYHNARGLPSQPIFGINDATIYLHNLRSAAATVAKYEEKQ